jgi:hypothetical protein
MFVRRDFLNIASQIAIKLFSIPFALIMSGLAIRRLGETSPEAYLFFASANYLMLFGLLQLGLSTYAVTRLSDHWARTQSLRGIPDIRGSFYIVLAVSTAALIIVLALGIVPGPVIPALIIMALAMWAAFAEYVRLGRGEVFISNILSAIGYVVCGGLMVWALSSDPVNVELAIVAAFAPAPMTSIAAFLVLLRDRTFRRLVDPRRAMQLIEPIRQTLPFGLFGLGSAVIISVPLAHQAVEAYPPLSFESLAALRLLTYGNNMYFFLLGPLVPIVMRLRHSYAGERFRVLLGRLILGLFALSAAGGLFFWLAGPLTIRLWLGGAEPNPSLAALWGVIAGLWLAKVTAVYFQQALFRVYSGVAALTAGSLAAFLAPLAAPALGPELGLIIGIGVSLLVSAALTLRAMPKPRGAAVARLLAGLVPARFAARLAKPD